jgi:hypothetical protein
VEGGGGGGAKAKIKIEQGKQKKKFEHEKFKKKFVQTLFNRENYKLCNGGPQIWKIKRFFDIRNGVRKHFLNLNVADIGAKNAF